MGASLLPTWSNTPNFIGQFLPGATALIFQGLILKKTVNFAHVSSDAAPGIAPVR